MKYVQAYFRKNGESRKLYIINLQGQLHLNVPGSIHYNPHDGAQKELQLRLKAAC